MVLMLVGEWSKVCVGRLVRGPEDVADELCHAFGSLPQEALIALNLGLSGRVTACVLVAVGTANVVRASPGEIFRKAVAEAAAGVLLAHNHPSGTTVPTQADLDLTRRVQMAGDILGIGVVDHLVLAGDRWRSLRESTELWGQG